MINSVRFVICIIISCIWFVVGCQPNVQPRLEENIILLTPTKLPAYPPPEPTYPLGYPSHSSIFPTAEIRPTPQCITATPSPITSTQEITTKLALHFLYEGFECLNFQEPKHYVKIDYLRDVLEVKPLFSGFFEENNQSKFILLARVGYSEGCHSCPGILGGIVFVKNGEQWQVETKDITIIEMWSINSLVELVQIGAEKYGVLLRHTSTYTGSSTEHGYLITQLDGELKRFYLTGLGETNHYLYPWAFTATIQFVPGHHPQFYDLEITTTGTKPFEGVISPFTEVQLYTFGDEGYTLTQTHTTHP